MRICPGSRYLTAILMAVFCTGLMAEETPEVRWYLTTFNGVPITRLKEERAESTEEGRAVIKTTLTETTRMRVRNRSYRVETTTRRVELADTLEAVFLEERRNENRSASTYRVRVKGAEYTVEIEGRQDFCYKGDVPTEGLYFRLDGEVLRAHGRLSVGSSMRGYVVVPEEGSMAYLDVTVKSRTKDGGYLLSVENVNAGGIGWEEECSREGIAELVRVGGVTKRLVAERDARLPAITPMVSNTLTALGRPKNLYKSRTVYLAVTLAGGGLKHILLDSMYSRLLGTDGGDTAYLVLTSTYVDGALPSEPLGEEDRRQYLVPGRLFELDHQTIGRALKQALAGAKGDSSLAKMTAVVRWAGKRLRGSRRMPAMASAVEAIENRGGDCTEHAAVVVALLRKVGIPCRMALGLVFDGRGFQFHAWVEAYVEGRWIPADSSYQRVGLPPSYILLGYAEGGMGDYETRAMNLISGGSIEFLDGNPLENSGVER